MQAVEEAGERRLLIFNAYNGASYHAVACFSPAKICGTKKEKITEVKIYELRR